MKKLNILFLLMVLLNNCKNYMDYKEFTSPQGWFTIKIPSNWAEYEDEKGTYAFFDTLKWTGNFRISPIKLESKNKFNYIKEYIDEEFNNNLACNPIRTKINAFECVSYKKTVNDAEGNLTMYYWILGNEKYLFTCSFTIPTENENLTSNNLELVKVRKILESIKT